MARINCYLFTNRTKEEAQGTATRRCPRRARFDIQEGTPGLVGGKWDNNNLWLDSQTWLIKSYLSKTD
jgi:hypothetical protein